MEMEALEHWRSFILIANIVSCKGEIGFAISTTAVAKMSYGNTFRSLAVFEQCVASVGTEFGFCILCQLVFFNSRVW